MLFQNYFSIFELPLVILFQPATQSKLMSTSNRFYNHTESITHSFGKQVIVKRTEQGLTRAQLAVKSQLSYKWLAMLERGELASASLYTLVSISNALDFYEWELFQLTKY